MVPSKVKSTWRVIVDSKASDPYTNMAIDEALFLRYNESLSRPTFRIYRWEPAALSLGYFQQPQKELFLDKINESNIPYVRRITGGGIIFHDAELTYSLVCSKDDLNIKSVKDSYRKLCSFIINTYKNLGLKASFANEKADFKKKNFSSFCFASNQKYDILIEGKKIGGNAQRRKKNVVFQHGSIPFKLDINRILSWLKNKSMENKVCSLEDALKKTVDYGEIKDLLVKNFKRSFKVDIVTDELTDIEKRLSRTLKTNKYQTDNWNQHRIDGIRKSKIDQDFKKTCLAK
jgi:lipoate-protein ligase A